ncbi:TadE/TadG family type IV pilus assembly protein [Phenylobacterium sp.]|uniref:TadE/TadG family type IV pilus assembly protein n=1 Tax=Phenylobacterium sp. TaxID=1871053 RepID=UPI0025FEF816|nr:TadE/TadG family type IV pilus assembly protein [Phenylobacterium sp.]
MFRMTAHIARVRAFCDDARGATAVEFALIAPVLFFSLLSLLEIGMLTMVSTNLDAAVVEAARKIRTGQSDGAASASSFEDQVCGVMGGSLSDCRDRLIVSVQKYSAFANANAAAAAQPSGQFDKGGQNDIILVKANYNWPLITPFLLSAYPRNGMQVTLSSRFAFKNEPFE